LRVAPDPDRPIALQYRVILEHFVQQRHVSGLRARRKCQRWWQPHGKQSLPHRLHQPFPGA
jgi:hypothetical protein